MSTCWFTCTSSKGSSNWMDSPTDPLTQPNYDTHFWTSKDNTIMGHASQNTSSLVLKDSTTNYWPVTAFTRDPEKLASMRRRLSKNHVVWSSVLQFLFYSVLWLIMYLVWTTLKKGAERERELNMSYLQFLIETSTIDCISKYIKNKMHKIMICLYFIFVKM